jgi:hypothetical protein
VVGAVADCPGGLGSPRRVVLRPRVDWPTGASAGPRPRP